MAAKWSSCRWEARKPRVCCAPDSRWEPIERFICWIPSSRAPMNLRRQRHWRRPSGTMAAKKKEFKSWSGADLGLADDAVGKAGAMYEVKEVLIPERKSKVEIITGTPEEAAATLVEKLRKEAKVL